MNKHVAITVEHSRFYSSTIFEDVEESWVSLCSAWRRTHTQPVPVHINRTEKKAKKKEKRIHLNWIGLHGFRIFRLGYGP